MPKTKLPRMKGWKGKSYNPKEWVEDPKVNKKIEELRRDDPPITIRYK